MLFNLIFFLCSKLGKTGAQATKLVTNVMHVGKKSEGEAGDHPELQRRASVLIDTNQLKIEEPDPQELNKERVCSRLIGFVFK